MDGRMKMALVLVIPPSGAQISEMRSGYSMMTVPPLVGRSRYFCMRKDEKSIQGIIVDVGRKTSVKHANSTKDRTTSRTVRDLVTLFPMPFWKCFCDHGATIIKPVISSVFVSLARTS
ncbi:uncharacterized protein HD556DRAFT_1420371 [Suillus plorans]|uniref:Uncharacterized protein n=1 Tax=Suillus plorans TaxID=116603 RepID=A0A9P7AB44_9AGAM|nr:uncharacterized protein HD556DRAFT_1420371 [Suillus plorans]KAG1785753.1 hypothetical protein HD556DRAFT_1420371 [Suillus plorans]